MLRAFDEELSGTLMRDHVSYLAGIHRVPASPGYHDAAEWVMARARAYGLSDVHAETFPGDGRTWFGTMRGNRGWRVEGGELTRGDPREVRRHRERVGGLQRLLRLQHQPRHEPGPRDDAIEPVGQRQIVPDEQEDVCVLEDRGPVERVALGPPHHSQRQDLALQL